jgi:hypothetical protein
MGGFMKYNNESRPGVVAYNDEDGEEAFGNIAKNLDLSRKEIEDRSKSIALAKTIVVLQTGWFVLSRKIEQLPPSSHSHCWRLRRLHLNIVTYLLRWNNPRGAQWKSVLMAVHNK